MRVPGLTIALFVLATVISPVIAGKGEKACPASEATIRRADTQSDPFLHGLAALARGDMNAAEAHFERALEENPDDFRTIFIGGYYRDGLCGIARDFAKEASVYTKGAARRNASALLELSLMTWNGLGVPEDKEGAIHLFRRGLIELDLLGGEADIPNWEGLVNRPVPPELLREFEWVRQLATTPGMGRSVAEGMPAKPSPDRLAACRYMALSFERHKDAETAYRLWMMHLGGQAIAPSRYYAYYYLDFAATLGHPAANAEIGRRMISKDIAMREDWQGLAWLLRAQRLGHDVTIDVETARRGMSAKDIREAEMQARILPPFDAPPPDGSRECIGNP